MVNVCPPAVIAPLREGPVLRATVNATVPWPLPLVPDEIVTQGTADDAVQEQPDAVCTTNDPWPPSSSMFALVGERVKAHPCPCVTVTVRPATVSVPVRTGPLIAAALYCTSPSPVPVLPEVTVNHEALAEAAQLHPAPAVTAILPVPPAAGTDALSGETAYVQPAVCVIVTRCPAIVTVPERLGPEVAATSSTTVPLPLPVERFSKVIHEASDVAVHGHAGLALMFTPTVPPEAPTDPLVGSTE